ncbi:hypothetical protein IAE22_34670, partial [Bacillus sp. S34]|nr:hypothetical protein [Bacillus sp. S34]
VLAPERPDIAASRSEPAWTRPAQRLYAQGKDAGADPLVHALDGVEHLPGVEVLAAHLALEFVREHVHQQLGVGTRVEVPPVDVEQLTG